MTAWWRGLSARERGLISLAVGVAGALAFIQFVMVPAHQERQSARRAYADAMATLAEVRAGVQRAAAETADSDDSASLRSALMQSARERGLAVARVQPLDDGALSLRFEAVDPVVLYDWLAAATDDRGAQVRQASLSRGDADGRVQATVVVQGGGA